MSSYKEFVKEMMPKMLSHPPKERLKMIAVEWRKKKGGNLDGGIISAAGLEAGQISAGRMSAAGLDGLSKKKRQKSEKSVASSKTHSKAVGGMLSSLKLTLPEGMKDSNKLSKEGAKRLIDHVAVKKGKEFASNVVMMLKHLLDTVGKKKSGLQGGMFVPVLSGDEDRHPHPDVAVPRGQKYHSKKILADFKRKFADKLNLFSEDWDEDVQDTMNEVFDEYGGDKLTITPNELAGKIETALTTNSHSGVPPNTLRAMSAFIDKKMRLL